MKKNYFLGLIIYLLAASSGFAQASKIESRCKGSLAKASVETTKEGNVSLQPCPGKQVLINNQPLANSTAPTATPTPTATPATASGQNVGAGARIYSDTQSDKLRFRTIRAGRGVTVTENQQEIVISSTSAATGSTPTTDKKTKEIYAADYSSLEEMITDAVSEDANRLIINKVLPCITSNLIISADLILDIRTGGKIVKSGECSLKFGGIGIANWQAQTAAFGSGLNVSAIGADYPKRLSTQIFDGGLSDKLNRVTYLLQNRKAIVEVYPGTFTSAVQLGANVTLEFKKGEYLNDADTYPLATIRIKDNTSFLCEPGATLRQSSVNPGVISGEDKNNYQLIQTEGSTNYNGFAGINRNIKIIGCDFVGSDVNRVSQVWSLIFLGNVKNAEIRNNSFDRIRSYAVYTGGFSHDPNSDQYSDNVDISSNKFTRICTQIAGTINGKNQFLRFNHFYNLNCDFPAPYSVIDLEPNTSNDVLENIWVESNTIDLRGANNYGEGITIHGARNAKTIYVRNNTILGTEAGLISSWLTIGINVRNVENAVITDNTVTGAGQISYFLQNLNNSTIAKNIVIGGRQDYGMLVRGVTNSKFTLNESLPLRDGNNNHITNQKITEELAEQTAEVQPNGVLAKNNSGFAYSSWMVGSKIKVNGVEYTIAEVIASHQVRLTTIPPHTVGTTVTVTRANANKYTLNDFAAIVFDPEGQSVIR